MKLEFEIKAKDRDEAQRQVRHLLAYGNRHGVELADPKLGEKPRTETNEVTEKSTLHFPFSITAKNIAANDHASASLHKFLGEALEHWRQMRLIAPDIPGMALSADAGLTAERRRELMKKADYVEQP
jgi:hypothetical protein